jgi:hypothetical protein
MATWTPCSRRFVWAGPREGCQLSRPHTRRIPGGCPLTSTPSHPYGPNLTPPCGRTGSCLSRTRNRASRQPWHHSPEHVSPKAATSVERMCGYTTRKDVSGLAHVSSLRPAPRPGCSGKRSFPACASRTPSPTPALSAPPRGGACAPSSSMRVTVWAFCLCVCGVIHSGMTLTDTLSGPIRRRAVPAPVRASTLSSRSAPAQAGRAFASCSSQRRWF